MQSDMQILGELDVPIAFHILILAWLGKHVFLSLIRLGEILQWHPISVKIFFLFYIPE